MFQIKLNCKNPFHKENDSFESKHFVQWEPKLSRNKAMNFQISRFDSYYLFDFALDIQFDGQDHAGPSLDIWILGFGFNWSFYDTRHWDYDKNSWVEG
jgi:hypothetical protein